MKLGNWGRYYIQWFGFLSLTLALGGGLFDSVALASHEGEALGLSEAYVFAMQIAKYPEVLDLLRERNSGKTKAEFRNLTNEAWLGLSFADPLIKSISGNPASQRIRKNSQEWVSEVFVSAKDGSKIAFLTKPTNWTHHGQQKHETPMRGKNWQGRAERDSSTGLHQIQIAVPVSEKSEVVGSVVVGISIAKWKLRRQL